MFGFTPQGSLVTVSVFLTFRLVGDDNYYYAVADDGDAQLSPDPHSKMIALRNALRADPRYRDVSEPIISLT